MFFGVQYELDLATVPKRLEISSTISAYIRPQDTSSQISGSPLQLSERAMITNRLIARKFLQRISSHLCKKS